MYPHDPEKAKALLKEAGVATPLELSLILPPRSLCARQGGEIIQPLELADVGINAKIQERRMGAVAQAASTRIKNYDLTIISHVEPLDIGIYAKPGYYFQYDSPELSRRHLRRRWRRRPNLDAYKAASRRDAQKKLAEDSVNAFLFQLPNVTVADAKLQRAYGRTRRSSSTTSPRCRSRTDLAMPPLSASRERGGCCLVSSLANT